jgi:glycine/D-amino acid oxidase-like deaminating enzyme
MKSAAASREFTVPEARFEPYWWAAAAPVRLAAAAPASRYDVAVIGSGFTGMRAALELARAGRSVVVLDSEPAGSGAARRNAGYLGRVLKKSLPTLMAKHGEAKGIAIYRELGEAFTGTVDFIAREAIDCKLTRHGRYIAATSKKHYDAMAVEFEAMRKHLGYPYEMVPAAEQRREFGGIGYKGGAVIPDLAAIHPGLYHRGLTHRAVEAGAVICDDVTVHAVQPEGDGVAVATNRGNIAVKDAIIATNGYTPNGSSGGSQAGFSWLAQRVIPFQAYMAATEILTEAQMDDAIPHRRTVLDSNTNIDFFRPAPDSPRLLFGGGTGIRRGGFEAIASFLHSLLGRVLPQLRDVRLEWVWTGYCAGTFDMMPHIGGSARIWYGLGYNFAGVPMGTHFGAKLANLVLGRKDGQSVFATGPAAASFPTMPLYSGNPWFVPLAMRYFDWKDSKRT